MSVHSRRLSRLPLIVLCACAIAACGSGVGQESDPSRPLPGAGSTEQLSKLRGANAPACSSTPVPAKDARFMPSDPGKTEARAQSGSQATPLSPNALKNAFGRQGRAGLEGAGRDYLAALERPEKFPQAQDLTSGFTSSRLNAEGSALVMNRHTVASKLGSPFDWNYRRGVWYRSSMSQDGRSGWFEQAGWLTSATRGTIWEPRHILFYWTGKAWQIECLSDAGPPITSDSEQAWYIAGLPGWVRYAS